MPVVEYVGSAPYCYSNSLAMALAVVGDAPPVPVIEVTTTMPFGATVVGAPGAELAFMSPAGWTPEDGIDLACELHGWTHRVARGGKRGEAIDRLRQAVDECGGALVGPLDMGLLLHHPRSGSATGADHFVFVHTVLRDEVLMHDPHGYANASLPIEVFAAAWRAQLVGYAREPFTMRSHFRRSRPRDDVAALRAAIPHAVQRLRAWASDTPANGEAVLLISSCLSRWADWQIRHLTRFAVPLGARRAADVAFHLRQVGELRAADTAEVQSVLFGRLQYHLVNNDMEASRQVLGELAPTYDDLRTALESSSDG